jgi:hypothetical protein
VGRALGAGALVVLVMAGTPGCTRPKGVVVSRQHLIQATGTTQAIWNRVREIEQAACDRKMVPEERCQLAVARDAEVRRMFREVDAAILVPGYEVDWDLILKTLQAIGSVLDHLPIP